MRMTFSCVLCALLVAACWANTSYTGMKTESLLRQAIMHLQSLIKKEHDIFLHSPTNKIEECCSQSALECFRKELTVNFLKNLNTSDSKSEKHLIEKLARNLSKPTIINSVNTCTEEEIKNVQCMSCNSYLKVKSKQFLINLQSHLQKAYSRLS